jgi:capsular polysaccharide biosynthesis protein
LRDTGEENYFHFYNDVLAKLILLKDKNIAIDQYTVVISKNLFSKTYFQFVLNNSFLKDLNWHIQADEWVHFNSAIFVKPLTHTKKYFDFFTNLCLTYSASTKANRRVFITRDRKSLRFIENMGDLHPILNDYNFEVIDAATIPFSEQIALFSNCELVIAIHGAGLTNIIYRNGKPMKILEIMPPIDYIPFHYILLSHQYGYRYDVLLGERGTLHNHGGFHVNATNFATKLSEMF